MEPDELDPEGFDFDDADDFGDEEEDVSEDDAD